MAILLVSATCMKLNHENTALKAGRVNLISDTGKYISRCTRCGSNPNALWTPVDLKNGKWAFQGDNGNYLARCNGCVFGYFNDFAFVKDANHNDPTAQWIVEYIDHIDHPLLSGRVNIQADNGKFLARCNHCGPGQSDDSAAVYETNKANPWAIWTVEQVGNRIALKADSGKYLSRCNNCWNRNAYNPNSAFVHVSNPVGVPPAQWKPIYLGNTTWALQADTTNFLSRCHACVIGGTKDDYAFV